MKPRTAPPAVKTAAKQVPAAPAKQAPAAAPSSEALVPVADLSNEAVLAAMLEDSGAGSESMGKDDLAIPRIGILQALSPQCQKRENTYVEGAEPGEIFDNVSQTIWSGVDGITVIPCTYRRTHLEWKPRDSGGGFVADHGPDDSVLLGCNKDDKGHYITKSGNIITPTAEYFILIYDEEQGVATPYVLSMSGAQLKHSRRWNTLINTLRVPNPKGGAFNPAMFFRTYTLTTAPESNDQGNWFGWNIKGADNVINLPDGMEIYNMAKAFRESVMRGTVKASAPAGDAPADSDDAPM